MTNLQLLTTTVIMKYLDVTDIVTDTGWTCITLICTDGLTDDFDCIDVWPQGKPVFQRGGGEAFGVRDDNPVANQIYAWCEANVPRQVTYKWSASE